MFWFLAACAWVSDKDLEERLDSDNDGVLVGEDCNDLDAEILGPKTWYKDVDEDGFGDDEIVIACEVPEGSWSLEGGDCDDTQDIVSPATPEICDGQDNDCDGLIDDDDEDVDTATGIRFFLDADEDGYGSFFDAMDDIS